MANSRSIPDAPLTWGDEADHRRRIAARANAIGYEQGPWTPTLDFTTTGDLSLGSVTALGYFWRVQQLVNFSFDLTVTPTFTTASGNLLVQGLPYQSAAGFPFSYFPIRLVGANITWPAGLTSLNGFLRPEVSEFEVALNGSLLGGVALKAADIASGNSLGVNMSGFYPIDI